MTAFFHPWSGGLRNEGGVCVLDIEHSIGECTEYTEENG